ncbi:HAD-IC family P-type ATPase [Candidatus Kaiserbacteria bacterium]|nr:HAD-IC family P-type ATPase [Candidatus Kaiserbacteria bacterium]
MAPSTLTQTRKVKRQSDVQDKNYAWHAHDVREVLSVLGSGSEGISEAEAKTRLKKHGLNKFTELPPPSFLSEVYKQLKSPLAVVLLLAFAATAYLHEFIDAGVILLALLIAVAIGVFQEGKASQAFTVLTRSQTQQVTVVRSGKKHQINTEELVPGDVILLESGSGVPADCRLVEVKQFNVNEASISGEWQSVDKVTKAIPVGTPELERENIIYMGSYVTAGVARAVVLKTGDTTLIGALAKSVQAIEDTETPLQIQIQKLSRVMLLIISVLVAAVFAIGLISGQSFHDMLLVAIAVSVASVPEGLPAAVTIILAVGMEALLKRGGLVRSLLAAETLGSTTYILTDKTGTLTRGKMSLTGIAVGEQVNYDTRTWKTGSSEHRLLDVALCAANAYQEEKDGKVLYHGDAVEQVIVAEAYTHGLSSDTPSLRRHRLDYLPFRSETRFAAGLSKLKGKNLLCVNGAPEDLLFYATSIEVKSGRTKLTVEYTEHVTERISELTREGKRLLAVAYKEIDDGEIDETLSSEELLEGLTFFGLLVLSDPIRPDVKKAIATVQGAGVEVLLVTGDNPETAHRVAEQVGISSGGGAVLTGSDLEELDDEELLAALEYVRVFARVLPEQKLRIAQVLQRRGEIVAMTGDGVNDAPALQRANIGVAVGSGTEVAKEAADLVLIDDSFKIVVAAIEEGRRIVANLRKIVAYLLSTSLSEVVLIAAALLTGGSVPILPTQILWANIVEEGLMSVAFAFERGEKNAMKRPPRDVHEEGVLSVGMLWFIAFVVTTLSILLLSLYFYLRYLELPIEELRSTMFFAISVDSIFMAFAFRSLSTPLWRTPLKENLFFVGSFLVSGLLLMVALSLPFFQYVLSYQPLPLYDIMLVIVFAIASLVTIEVGKWVFFRE